jgi:hypothetical protein
MKESSEMLRLRFEAETNYVPGLPDGWKKYAEWLERIEIKQLNNEVVRDNTRLRTKMQKAMDVLEEGIAGTGR